MLRIILLSILFTTSCSTLDKSYSKDFYPMYVSIDGLALWFENPGTPEMVLCSGHTCISVGQSFCDDYKYYCVDDLLLKIRIPKNIEGMIPEFVTDDFGTENIWTADSYRYEVTPISQGRIIPNRSRYQSEISIFGESRAVYNITSYEEGSDIPISTVLYSIEHGIVAIEARYAGDIYKSYWLKGRCGYLANVGCVETHR